MSLESDIERLKLQEQKLRFEKFDEADAWKLGTLMRDAAIARAVSAGAGPPKVVRTSTK